MSTTITPEEMYFGAPATLTVGGIDCGATLEPPKVSIGITSYKPDFENAKGPVKNTVIVTKVMPKISVLVNEISAVKAAWAMPGAASVTGTAAVTTAGADQTLAADAAAAATVIQFPGVTLANPSAAADDIIDTVAAHGFVLNQKVRFESLTGGAGLVVGTDYFVIAANLAATTFQVSLTLGGAAVNFTTDITAGVAIPAYLAGQFIRVGDAGETEIHVISVVGTSGAGGTGLTLTAALIRAHDTGDQIRQVVDAGTTSITWTPGRVPSSAYQDVVLEGPGLDGRVLRVTLNNCLSSKDFEMEFGNAKMSGMALEFEAHYDPAAPTVVPMTIELI